MKTPMHKHLLLRGFISNAPTSEQVVIDWLRDFVGRIGMKVVQGPFASMITEEGNRGLTASVMIETSHIAFHIWDEMDPSLIQFDLYTCSELNVLILLSINIWFLIEKMGLKLFKECIQNNGCF